MLIHSDGAPFLACSVRVGYFYAVLPLGTPAKTFHVIVDTGSTVTYVPCNDCRHCGPDHDGAPFNPSQSPTAKWVGCGDAQCKAQVGGGRGRWHGYAGCG